MVRKHSATPVVEPPNPLAQLGRAPNRPLDLPVYGKEHMKTEA